MADAYLAADFREQPYWWDATPPAEDAVRTALPRQADVAVVGGGLTGLNAALELARAGRSVAVLDGDGAGFGASRRNAGYIGRTLKRTVEWLSQHHGAGKGEAIYRELDDALKFLQQVVRDEKIDCHLDICGRFIGANSPAHYELLARDLEDMNRKLGFPFELLSKSEQRREIASDLYHGGAVIPDLGSIHSGLYHRGLLERAVEAGATIVPGARVQAIASEPRQHRIDTELGPITARDVIVTTNGYTPRELSWLSRRVIPFPGYMCASEILPAERITAMLPKRRTYIDTNLSVTFLRPAPDTSRLLFGGYTGMRAERPLDMVAPIVDLITGVLPDMRGVKVSRAWTGQCAGTFDYLPHIGTHDGIHYGLGYNFAGLPVGTLFGRKLAWRVLGRTAEARSAFETDSFPTLPFYNGNPWFVPLAMRFFAWEDRRLARRTTRAR